MLVAHSKRLENMNAAAVAAAAADFHWRRQPTKIIRVRRRHVAEMPPTSGAWQ